jgi:hypothetical protein
VILDWAIGNGGPVYGMRPELKSFIFLVWEGAQKWN